MKHPDKTYSEYFTPLVRILRTARPLTSDCPSEYFGLPVRLLLTLLLLTASVSGTWGQTGTNRSGVYYFVNCGSGKVPPNFPQNDDPIITDITDPDNYYYLVPADNPQLDNKRDAWFSSNYSSANGDPEKPYLTTYRTIKDAADVPSGVTNRPHNSVWIVKFASTYSGTDYYYLIHAATGKYVVYEPPYLNKNNRKSVHLLTTDSPEDNAKFAITLHSDYYNFRPKSIGTGGSTNKYLNAANANYNFYYSSDGKSDGDANYYIGLVGLWKDAGDGSDWMPEATKLDAPTISDVDANNKVTIADANSLPAGYEIRYTTNGSTPTASTGTVYSGAISITASVTIKAVVVRYGMVLTEVASETREPVPCATPIITFDNTTSKVSITCATTGSTIYYTTNGNTPTASSTPYNDPFSIDSQTTVIKAIAIKSGFVDSEIASIKVLLNPIITLAQTEYTYDGSAKEPTVTSVIDGETSIDTNEYSVDYSNNVNAGTEATVIIVDNPGGEYIVSGSTTFTILHKAVTITANDASKTYDGTALTENGFTASELETGDTHTFNVTMTEGSTITNAGTEPNVIATVDGSSVTTGIETAIGNYLVTTANGTLTISPKIIGDGDTAAEGITVEMTEDGLLNAVKDGSTTLVENTDYTQETVEEGSDKIITITGKGNYTGIVKGIYASPQFDDPDGDGGGQAAAVYMAKRDLSCPSGINPYIIRKVNPSIGTAVITPLDYIPVDVPVLLLSDAEASGFVASPKDPSTPEVTAQTKNSNLLKVSAGGETVKAAQIYMFYKGEFVLTKAGTLGEGKFYLNNPNYADTPTNENNGNSNARGLLQFVIDDEEPTGITEFETSTTKEPDTDVWYTLDGRRLSVKPTKAGIYIHQGQKEYIKR